MITDSWCNNNIFNNSDSISYERTKESPDEFNKLLN